MILIKLSLTNSPSIHPNSTYLLKCDDGQWRTISIIYNNNQSIRMGLWPWAFFSQIFTPKFWKSLKVDGLINTYQRGHKAVMNTHTVGGNSARTRYVGMDQYGNKYYEDFDPLYRNQRRWVEYNDYLSVRSPNGDMVPPKWHGWLSHQYDEVPTPESTSFYDPFFEKPHEWNFSYSPFKQYTSRMANANPRALDYAQYRKNRYSAEWEATTKRA